MATFPTFAFADNDTKVRFKEPFVSEALNRKDYGVIPTGIYKGFDPIADTPAGDFLRLDVDGTSSDSVAVIETATGSYNLSVRAPAAIDLDFTAHGGGFPIDVVLRTNYNIAVGPTGLTTSDIVTIPGGTALPSDVILTSITSLGPMVLDNSSRQISQGVFGGTQQVFQHRIVVPAVGLGFSESTSMISHSLGLTGITPVTDFTDSDGAVVRRQIFSYTCDQGLVLIEQAYSSTTNGLSDGGVRLFCGATTAGGPGGVGLVTNDVTFRVTSRGTVGSGMADFDVLNTMTFIPGNSTIAFL